MFLLHACSSSWAITYYSRSASGYWTNPASWSTVTYGNATNTGAYPQKGDVVFIGDGHRIIMDMNAVCASVTVGQGLSGQLEFSDYLSFTMTIAGTLTVNKGGIVNYPGNKSKSHNLFISRNIINDGTLDMFTDPNDLVNIVFNSSVNSVISGSGTFDLNRVSLAKSGIVYTLEAQVASFENAIRNLVLSKGTFVHDNSGTFNFVPGSVSVAIGCNAIVRIPQGTVHFAPDGDYLYLEGGLELTGGTAIVGDTAGLRGIHYSETGSNSPFINISAGILEVRGGIMHKSGDPLASLDFNMSGGNLLLNSGINGAPGPLLEINDVPGSTFTMSNGTIVFQNPNSVPTSNTDFTFCGTQGTVNVTSGTVEFGNSFTKPNARFSFEPFSAATYPNFKVTGAAANAITLCTSPGSTNDFRLMSLQIDANKAFDIRSISGLSGDTKSMTLTFEMDGINAMLNDGNFIARSGNVQFEALEGQWISGSSTTVFYDFTINNPYGLVINTNIEVSNLLSMTNGIIYSSALYPVVLNPTGNSTLGSALSFVEGPVKKQVSSTAPQTITFPVGKNTAHRPVILNVVHNSMAMTDYTTEVWNTSAVSLGLTLPADLRWVSHVRYYTIVPSSTSSLVSARVTLSYGSDDGVNDYTSLRVGRDDGAGAWINSGGTATGPVTGSVTSGTFSSFNTLFTLANPIIGSNWLPIEMLSFRGKQQDHYNVITWSTATEINSSYFELQRSFDGINFETVSKITAAGNTSQILNYSYKDYSVSQSAYYRLKQVDLNGSFEWSEIIMVAYSNKASLLAYPNPSANGMFNIRMDESDDINIAVSDMSGRILPLSFHRSGNELKSDTALSPGVYLIRTGSPEGEVTRLVVADTD